MKFTLKWLKKHIQTDKNPEKIADILTKIGFEVNRTYPSISLIVARQFLIFDESKSAVIMFSLITLVILDKPILNANVTTKITIESRNPYSNAKTFLTLHH